MVTDSSESFADILHAGIVERSAPCDILLKVRRI